MKKYLFSTAGYLLPFLLVAGFIAPAFSFLAQPASASGDQSAGVPVAQFTPFPTPTPLPDGRIVYLAIEGDSAWRIAAIFGLDLDELRNLNKWGENPTIQKDQQIILGFASAAEPPPAASGPTPTPAPILPTPSPEPGWAELCILLYNDVNGDSMRQETEGSLPGGAISISNRAGSFSVTADTVSGLDFQCFKNVPEGSFFISVAVPDGYSPTTQIDYALEIVAGEKAYVPFGAQANSETEIQMPTPQGSGRSPLLAMVGAGMLVIALGLALYATRIIRFK
jgi:hypothetical protein